MYSPGERQFWKKREQWITSQPKHDHHGDEHFQNIKHGTGSPHIRLEYEQKIKLAAILNF